MLRRTLLAAPLLVLALASGGAALPHDDVCVPTCTVLTTTAAYAPPLIVVPSGGTVTWTSNDLPNPIHHTATSLDRCFNAAYTGATPGDATFRIADGALYATGDGPEKRCPEATVLPDGSALLGYECLYHAQMRGFVLVNP